MAQTATARRLKAVPHPDTNATSDRPPGEASLDEVRELAEGMSDKFLQCRELTHNWLPFNVGRHRDGGYERTLRCSRCRTRKIQHLDINGMLIGSPRYEHAEGYLVEGMGRITSEGRGMLRVVSIARSTGAK